MKGKYTKNYNGFILCVDDYKENNKFQFHLETSLPFINTDLDFDSPEDAFFYAEEMMLINFSKIINELFI